MTEYEKKRRGPKEKPVPQKSPDEYTAAERMRLARQNAGKNLSETARELHYHPNSLSYVERGIIPVSKKLASQYERLFNCEPGQIINTVYERPRKGKKQQEPPLERK